MSATPAIHRRQLARAITATGLASLLTGGALAGGSLLTTALADHGDDPLTHPANLTSCVQLFALFPEHGPYDTVIQEVQDPPAGTHVHGPVSVTVTHEDGEPKYLDLDVDAGFDVTAVIVKGGPSSNVYFDQLTGLHAPINPNNDKPHGISHYTICGSANGGDHTSPAYPKPPKTTPPTTPPPTTPPPTTPPPTTPPEEPEEPGIELAILEPICDDDVPYLEYVITADEELEATTVTMTWVNPDGDDVVYENLPLAARVLWAGAVIGEDGSPLDWPGWIQLEDGTWVQGDDGFEWVRPEVEIIFDVNPELSVTVDYPPSEPDCDANPPQNGPPPEELPETGGPASSMLLAGMGALLLAVGASLALFGRRLARSNLS